MAKLSQLPLQDLYEKKITASVEAEILKKEDFSKGIVPIYCKKVCRLKCKRHEKVNLLDSRLCGEVDVLVIQDHDAPSGQYDRFLGQQEQIQSNIRNLLFERSGLKGLNVQTVNLLKCAVNEVDFPNGKSPTATVQLKCRPYLYEEIKRVKPKVIISSTTTITKALGLKNHSNKDHRGHVVPSMFGIPVVISLHTKILTMIRQTAQGASGMWSADYFEVIRRDWEKAARVARGELKVPPLEEAVRQVKTKHIHICRSIEEVKHYTDQILGLPETCLVSWDIETTGLDGWHPDAKLLCSQFGFKPPGQSHYQSVVIPLWHRENHAYDPDEAWPYVRDILLSDVKKIGWNVKFDLVYTAAATGVRARNIEFDGLLALHMLDSGANGTYSLKSAVSDFMPESGLQGYEDLLPGLTKTKKTSEDDEETSEEE